PTPAPTPAPTKPTCAGTVTIGTIGSASFAAVTKQLASAPCTGAMAVIRTGSAIAWAGHVSSTSANGGKLTLTVTRTTGPGQHPLVMYTAQAPSGQTVHGQLSAQTLRARKMTPATYTVAYTSAGKTVALG